MGLVRLRTRTTRALTRWSVTLMGLEAPRSSLTAPPKLSLRIKTPVADQNTYRFSLPADKRARLQALFEKAMTAGLGRP